MRPIRQGASEEHAEKLIPCRVIVPGPEPAAAVEHSPKLSPSIYGRVSRTGAARVARRSTNERQCGISPSRSEAGGVSPAPAG
jgi:hypothetical protein